MADAKTIPLESIRIDGATQPRCMIDEAAVAEYAEDMRDGFPFPPVTVFHDGAVNWLADGFHRYHGARRAGLDSILARVESGTVSDARWFACGANRTHGLRRTNADKRRAVEMALKEHPEKSDRAIAEHVGVHHDTVAGVRAQVADSATCQNTGTRTGADGKRYPVPPPRPIPPVPPPLVTGHDVLALGIRPGPRVGVILRAVQDRQLNGDITTREEALAVLAQLATET